MQRVELLPASVGPWLTGMTTNYILNIQLTIVHSR